MRRSFISVLLISALAALLLYAANPVRIAHNASQNTPSVTIDSTGANFLWAVVACESCGIASVGDSTGSQNNGNFTLVGRYNNGIEYVSMYYYASPTHVGSNHIATCSGCAFNSLYFGAYSGMASSPLEAQTGNATATATITPACSNELVLSGFKTNSGTVSSVSGMTLLDGKGTVSGSYGGGSAESIQTTAAAVTATWSVNSTSATIIATFLSTSSVCGSPAIRHSVTGGN